MVNLLVTIDSAGSVINAEPLTGPEPLRDAVLEYFSACRSFWKMGGAKLDEWSAIVRQGAIPNFGANLAY
jgi:hypothetical protein